MKPVGHKHGWGDKKYRILFGQYKRKIMLGDQRVDWTIILKRILNYRMQENGFYLFCTKCGPLGPVGSARMTLLDEVRHL
jgi:hypothetical protein